MAKWGFILPRYICQKLTRMAPTTTKAAPEATTVVTCSSRRKNRAESSKANSGCVFWRGMTTTRSPCKIAVKLNSCATLVRRPATTNMKRGWPLGMLRGRPWIGPTTTEANKDVEAITANPKNTSGASSNPHFLIIKETAKKNPEANGYMRSESRRLSLLPPEVSRLNNATPPNNTTVPRPTNGVKASSKNRTPPMAAKSTWTL